MQEHTSERIKIEENLKTEISDLEKSKAVLEERVSGLDQAVNTMQTHNKTQEETFNKQVRYVYLFSFFEFYTQCLNLVLRMIYTKAFGYDREATFLKCGRVR